LGLSYAYPVAESQTAPVESSARLHQVAGILVASAVIIAVLVAVFASGSTSELRPGKPVPGAPATISMLKGIHQSGLTLGDPSAPVTLFEYGDLQCPSCASFAQEELPGLIRSYVRTGQVRIVFKPLDIIGPESTKAARMAVALGGQDRLWQFIDLMYRNQGSENTGYVTSTYLKALASAIPGANVNRALAAGSSARVSTVIARASAQARELGVNATPSFTVAKTSGGKARALPASAAAESSVIEEAIEGELRHRG
jgi:protein-disulfide isomerase